MAALGAPALHFHPASVPTLHPANAFSVHLLLPSPLQLTNWVISSELEPLPSRPKRGPKAAPAAASLPSLDSAPAPSTDARASAAAAGVASSFSSLDATSPAPGSLSTPQFEALLAACATYRLADRALALFEHAVGSGWVPTRPALQAVAVALENKLPPPGRDPAARLAAYRAFLPLVAAARLPVDGELAASLVALLLGTSSSSGGGAHAAPPIAKAGAGAAPSPTLDALLDEAARLVAELPDVEVSRSSALQTLLLGCLRAGRRERAMATLGALQVRRVPLSSSLFNQLMYHETLGHSSASGGNNKLGAVQVYLELMQDSGVAPDAGTLLSLTHAFLASPPASAATSSGKGKSAAAATSVNDGTGVAAFVTAAAASLRVPLNHRVLGLAAFHAAKHGNVKELEAVLGLLRGMDWPADKPQPRWYRKLAAFLASHEVHA